MIPEAMPPALCESQNPTAQDRKSMAAALPAEEAAIAAMVFRGGDMDHDGRLSFSEFATVAVLLSAARSPPSPHYHPRTRTEARPAVGGGRGWAQLWVGPREG